VTEARRLKLAADLGRGQALHALLKNEAPDLAAMGLGFRPDHEDIRDGLFEIHILAPLST
jgi:hypothetical protein